jgi:hypothetical protein
MAARYYHGGPAGLSWVLPPAETGAKSCSEYGGAAVHRTDRVYVTTEKLAALIFAVGQGPTGTVYEVAPIGELEADPDCDEPGMSYACPRARVVRKVTFSDDVRRHALKALRGLA